MRTADLSESRLDEIHELMLRAFDGDFPDGDWQHALGGWHVLATAEDGTVVSHAAVVDRTLEVGGTPWRTGYVEGVATQPERQGEGFGSAVMRRVTEILHTEQNLGALATSSHGFYTRLGWERWRGPSFVRDGDETRRTADEDAGIMVLRYGATAGLDLEASILCESRVGDDW